MALLAFLGAGEGKTNVDVLAHLWGFCAGFPIGFLASFLKAAPAKRSLQFFCGCAALLLMMLAWILACRGV
jgi:hypothetical protein